MPPSFRPLSGTFRRYLVNPIAGRLARDRSGTANTEAFSISESLKAPRKILIVPDARPGGIFLAAPHIWAIRHHYPNAHLGMLVRSDREYIAREIPFLNDRIVYEEFSVPFGGKASSAVEQVEKAGVDVAFCFSTEDSIAPTYLCGKSRAGVRIGFQRADSTHLNIQVVPREDAVYETHRLALLPRILGIPEAEDRVSWSVSDDGARRIQERFLVGRRKGERFVALDISSTADQRPSMRHYQAFAKALLKDKNTRLVLFFDQEASKSANQDAVEIRKSFGARVLPIQADELPKVVALLAACDLLVAANTDLFHLAVSVSLPVLGILPNGEVGRWAPNAPTVHAYPESAVREWGTEGFASALEKALASGASPQETSDPVAAAPE